MSLSAMQKWVLTGAGLIIVAFCSVLWNRLECIRESVTVVAATQQVYLERLSNLERTMLDRTAGLQTSAQSASEFALRDARLEALKAAVSELRADFVEHIKSASHAPTATRLAQIDGQISTILKQIEDLRENLRKEGGR